MVPPTLLLLLLLSSTGLCCNPGWTEVESSNRCYQIWGENMTFDDAEKHCGYSGGLLAAFDDHLFSEFIDTFNHSNSDLDDEYWVHYSPSGDEGCTFIKGKRNFTGECSDNKGFVCEEFLDTSFTCPPPWTRIGEYCYHVQMTQSTYNGGQLMCKEAAEVSGMEGSLAVLSTSADKVSPLVGARAMLLSVRKSVGNPVFFVGATKNSTSGSGFAWENGEPFADPCCNLESGLECVGYGYRAGNGSAFHFEALDCSSLQFFLCQAHALRPSTSATTLAPPTSNPVPTTTPEEATTPIPLVCPVGYNWKPHTESGFCYWETTYETERLNWFQAREFCQLYGGDLATYRDRAQELHGLGGAKGHYRGLWFGLKRDPDGNMFEWVDGSEVNYTNWDTGEPNLRSPSHFCVSHSAFDSKWELDYCGHRRWFICKAPKVESPILPNTNIFKKTLCNSTGVNASADELWYLHKEHCYLVSDKSKYSWGMARKFCRERGAELASIHSFHETDFVLFAGEVSPSVDYWTGLSSLGLRSAFRWSDDSPLDFFYWGADQNTSPSSNKDTCIAFDRLRGYWKAWHCNTFLGAICKRHVNATQPPTPATAPPPRKGNCEPGWFPSGDKCYKLFGEKWTQRKTFSEAEDYCKNKSSTLASIHSDEDQNFLTDLMLNVESETYIGLKKDSPFKTYEWKDDTIIDHTNWGPGQPSYLRFGADQPVTIPLACVTMMYVTDSMGQWKDGGCFRQLPYICQKLKDPSLLRPSDDPFACPDLPGWWRLGRSCYRSFPDTLRSWTDAQTACLGSNGNLATASSSAIQLFLQRKINATTTPLWIGVYMTALRRFESVGGATLAFAPWQAGQPQRAAASPLHNCVAVDAHAQWLVARCDTPMPYICEWTPKEVVKEEVPPESCPKNMGRWEDLGGENCYFFHSQKRSWNEAMHFCFTKGGFLSTFHSEQEVDLVRKRLEEDESVGPVYIGLATKEDGSFAWVDHSAVDFTNWAEEVKGACAIMSVTTGKWTASSTCSTPIRFVCSYPKKGFKEPMLLNSTTASATSSREQKSRTGMIVVIFFCLLLMAVVAGVATYYFGPARLFLHRTLVAET